jgi:hypothetical protein
MTRQILNRGTIANDGTGDTLRTASLKIEQNFQELYNKLGDGSSLMSLIDFDSDAIVFEGSTLDDFETRLRADNPTADRTVRIPNYTGHLVMDSATQTLANKTLISPTITNPQINDTSSNHQYILSVNELSADRTVTLPLLTGNDTFVFNNHAATLINKTLQAPTINNPIIYDTIKDSSGNELLKFVKAAAALNYVIVKNSATGQPATIQAAGEANSSLELLGSGNGGVRINSKLVLKTGSSSGTISANDPITLFNSASPASHSLENGTTSLNGEIKYLVNKGAGTQTVNESINNIAAYSSITMPQNSAVTLAWFDNQWIVINNQGATLNV